jgi:peptide/nickel transport system permease protein
MRAFHKACGKPMALFILRRLLQGAQLMIAMSVIVFVGVYLIGNPVDILIHPAATQQQKAEIIARLGLDRPLWEQYGNFMLGALRGDLGTSYVYRVPAFALILKALPATLELAVCAMLLALAIGIPLGLWAGYRPDSVPAQAITAFSILGFSLPTFWVGLMLIVFFSVDLALLPSGGRGATSTLLGVPLSVLTLDGLRHLALPAFSLALFKIGLVIRLTRASMQETLRQDFVRFARAKGVPERRVVLAHVFRNIQLPLVTVVGMEFGSLVAFAVVTETVFSWPGMGKLIIDSIGVLDRPVIVAYLMFTAFLFVVINLLVDIAYSMLDPRVRLAGR